MVLALWPAGISLAQSALPPGALTPLPLSAGFMRSSFSGVNETDARAAFKLFAIRMGEKYGYAIAPEVHIFDDATGLAAYLKERPLDVVIINTWDYLALAPIPNLPVVFSTVAQGVVAEECVLLGRADSNLAGFADLAGKHVIVLNSGNANLVRHWFRTEILALGRGAPEEFLGRLEVKERISPVVLPVFFGQADACALDRGGLETMIELNPQIGNTLRVLAQSEPQLSTVCLIRLEGWDRDDDRRDLLRAMQELPNDTAGRQILTLFKSNGVIPFEARHLDTVRALRKRHDELVAGRQMPAAAPDYAGTAGTTP